MINVVVRLRRDIADVFFSVNRIAIRNCRSIYILEIFLSLSRFSRSRDSSLFDRKGK